MDRKNCYLYKNASVCEFNSLCICFIAALIGNLETFQIAMMKMVSGEKETEKCWMQETWWRRTLKLNLPVQEENHSHNVFLGGAVRAMLSWPQSHVWPQLCDLQSRDFRFEPQKAWTITSCDNLFVITAQEWQDCMCMQYMYSWKTVCVVPLRV